MLLLFFSLQLSSFILEGNYFYLILDLYICHLRIFTKATIGIFMPFIQICMFFSLAVKNFCPIIEIFIEYPFYSMYSIKCWIFDQ